MCQINKIVDQIIIKHDGGFTYKNNNHFYTPKCCYVERDCNINCTKCDYYFNQKEFFDVSDEYVIKQYVDNTKFQSKTYTPLSEQVLIIETCGKTFETNKYEIEDK